MKTKFHSDNTGKCQKCRMILVRKEVAMYGTTLNKPSMEGIQVTDIMQTRNDCQNETRAGFPQKTLPEKTVSKVTVVRFYDMTGLIKETIGTPESALSYEILINIIVIIVMIMNLRASLIISRLLPILDKPELI